MRLVKTHTRAVPYAIQGFEKTIAATQANVNEAPIEIDDITLIEIFKNTSVALRNAAVLPSFSKMPSVSQMVMKEAIEKIARLGLKLKALGL